MVAGLRAGGRTGVILAGVVAAVALYRWRPGNYWWRPGGSPTFHGFKTDGDLLIMGNGGAPVPVPWSQLTRVWFMRPNSEQLLGTVQVEMDDGFERHRFSVPMVVRESIFEQLGDTGEFRRECLAHGVEILDERSGLKDTDPALLAVGVRSTTSSGGSRTALAGSTRARIPGCCRLCLARLHLLPVFTSVLG
jgi:hypothetical protein